MYRLMLSSAALALAAVPLHADAQGNGKGNGNGGGNKPAQVDRGNGGGGNGNGNARGNGGGKPDRAERTSVRGNGNGNGNANRPDRPVRMEARGNGNGNGNANRAERQVERRVTGNGNGNANGKASRTVTRDVRVDRGGNYDYRSRDYRDRDYRDRDGTIRIGGVTVRDNFYDRDGNPGLIDGCPPGLAKKYNGCQPPGLARSQANYFDNPDYWGYRLNDGRYRYDDGYLYRVGGDGGILSYLPLLAGALSPGNVWPSSYAYSPVPQYYQDYYSLGGNRGYRYADDVIYRVDPDTAAITSIAALLTGDEFVVGQPAPRGYDVYNVPYSYRDRYRDGPDSYYRYSDGYIYEMDPETRLVASAIELLT